MKFIIGAIGGAFVGIALHGMPIVTLALVMAGCIGIYISGIMLGTEYPRKDQK